MRAWFSTALGDVLHVANPEAPACLENALLSFGEDACTWLAFKQGFLSILWKMFFKTINMAR